MSSSSRFVIRPGRGRGTVALLIAAALSVLGIELFAAPVKAARQGAMSHVVMARIATAAANPVAKLGSTGVVFGGFTTQRWASFFQVSKDGKTLVAAGIGLDMTCTSGGSFSMPDGGMVGVPIAHNRFKGSYAIPLTVEKDGSYYSGSGKMSATFNLKSQTLSGTWDAHTTFISPTGTRDECDSGTVRFTDRQ